MRPHLTICMNEDASKEPDHASTLLYNIICHLQIISKYYQKMNAVLGHDQKFEFEDDLIRLDIPFPSLEGLMTENKGWRITALGPPVVSCNV